MFFRQLKVNSAAANLYTGIVKQRDLETEVELSCEYVLEEESVTSNENSKACADFNFIKCSTILYLIWWWLITLYNVFISVIKHWFSYRVLLLSSALLLP